MAQAGIKHPNWRGGRTITQHGYVLIRKPDHHLADVRGYVFEHRYIAEQVIGRSSLPSEQVHHIDGDRQNNQPCNLEVMNSIAHHGLQHKKPRGSCGCLTNLILSWYVNMGVGKSFVNMIQLVGRVITYHQCIIIDEEQLRCQVSAVSIPPSTDTWILLSPEGNRAIYTSNWPGAFDRYATYRPSGEIRGLNSLWGVSVSRIGGPGSWSDR